MSIIRRAYDLTDVEVRADTRHLIGTVVPYNIETRIGGYVESFASGAFPDVDAGKVPLLISHRHSALPVGHAVELRDEPTRLAGEFHLSDTRDADEVLSLAKDGVPLGLSVGFVPQVDRWTSDRKRVVRVRAVLAEVSVVGVGAYPGAKVEAVRANLPAATPLLHLARRR
jgi:HK97 family phage prohead protease